MANRGNLCHFCVDFKKAFDSVLDFFRVLALNVAAKKLCSPCRYKEGQRFIVFLMTAMIKICFQSHPYFACVTSFCL